MAAGSDDSLFLELLEGCGYVISEIFCQSGLFANKITGYIRVYSTRTGFPKSAFEMPLERQSDDRSRTN